MAGATGRVGRHAVDVLSAEGHDVVAIAARNPDLAAAIAQTPLVDGPAVTPNAMRHQTPLGFLRFTGRALLDAAGGLVGRAPLLVPLAGEPGTVTSLTSPDALNGSRALNPDDKYPHWQQEVAARSALRVGFYRPGRHASRVQCPLLVLAYHDDCVATPGPAVSAAQRAPRGEGVRLPGGHYEPFMEGHERRSRSNYRSCDGVCMPRSLPLRTKTESPARPRADASFPMGAVAQGPLGVSMGCATLL